MEQIDKQYMPLDGEELLEIIHRKMKPLLAGYNQYFGRHLAYHNPWIRFAVKVECFTPEGTPTDGGFELSLPLCDIVFEPDRIREECGLGMYETRLVDEYSGTLADVKVGERPPEPDVKKTLEKVAALLDQPNTEEQKPKKVKRAKKKKRHGWPKGKPRGPRVVPTINEAAFKAP